MAAGRMMGARVEESWAEEIEEIAASRGITTAEVCREAIGAYLGKEAEAPSLKQRVQALEKRLDPLQEWANECEEWGNDLEKRLTTKLGPGWG